MKIADFIKRYNCRLSLDNAWLVFDGNSGQWVVYARRPYAKKTMVMIETDNEEQAVKALIRERLEI